MKLNDVAEGLLGSAVVYLQSIPSEIYQLKLDLLFGASIGEHTRHFLEFYQCLLSQVDSGGSHHMLDYALRERDARIETEPAAALELIRSITDRLKTSSTDFSIRLAISEYAGDAEGQWIESSFERELLYNIEHTIHHLAIIKIGLAAVAPDIQLPEHFGVAPSTVRHRKNICAQ